jgi:hypothetical protein
MQKLNYLLRSVRNILQDKHCPYCGGKDLELVERKYVVTSLLRCAHCGLLHRHPRDSKQFLDQFYQTDYKVEVQMMTDLPADAELVKLKSTNFSGLRDYLPLIIAAAKKPASQIKLIDYGCSWGYNVFKLKQERVDAEGFELSVPRARFGEEKLAVRIASREEDIRGGNDLLFSSHVIEHLPAIQDFVALSRQKLLNDGVFMAFCPNGSREFQARQPELFNVTWGSLHPNYLDVEFARHVFRKNPYLIMTSDWPYHIETIENWDGETQHVDADRSGYELLIIAKPNIEI